MRKWFLMLTLTVLLGCSSSTSINLGNPLLTAAVNVPVALSMTQHNKAMNCADQQGSVKERCLQTANKVKQAIAKHQKR